MTKTKKRHRKWFTRDETAYILGVDRSTLDGWLQHAPKNWFLGAGHRYISFSRVRKHIESNGPLGQADTFDDSMDRLLSMINRLCN